MTEISRKLAEEEGLESEFHLASRHKVAVKSMASLRRGHFRENYHWVLRNSSVYYTPIGVQEVEGRLGALEPEKEQEETKFERAWFGPPRGTTLSENIVEVIRVPTNPRMLICIDQHGHSLSIRGLRSNKRFTLGMRIDLEKQCKKNWDVNYPDGRKVYNFIGRLPRTHGRW